MVTLVLECWFFFLIIKHSPYYLFKGSYFFQGQLALYRGVVLNWGDCVS